MEDETDHEITVRIANAHDVKYVYEILAEMESSAKARGTGIARRSPQSICEKIFAGHAVIALDGTNWVGFSYLQPWGNDDYVSNSGLIVAPFYRHSGVAKAIKQTLFELSRTLYPEARIFSITTGPAVLSMNHDLGFEPVVYDSLTRDEAFWDQCKQCVNYPILASQGRKRCLCTAMLFTPPAKPETGLEVQPAVRPALGPVIASAPSTNQTKKSTLRACLNNQLQPVLA